MRKKFTKGGLPIMDPATGEQYVEREYSDQLLAFLLRGRRSEVFGDTSKILPVIPMAKPPTVLMFAAPPEKK